MRRSDREQDRDFALALIDRCAHGVMALSTGEDAPYCLPLSFVRMGERLYFHCAKEGHKADLLRGDPRVCVTFVGEDQPAFSAPCMYTTYFQSVIAVGRAFEVTDDREKIDVLRALCQKLTPDHVDEGFDHAVAMSLSATAVWGIDLEQITGKEKKAK